MARLLADEPDLEVVGEASSGAECLELARTLQPDAIVLDLNMPGPLGGLEVTRALRQAGSSCSIVILSSECVPVTVRELVRLGVKGYVSKCSEPSEVVRALQMARAGRTYLSSEAAEALACSVLTPEAGPTGRDREVLELSGRGLTVREIGEQLNLSPKTVEKVRSRILQQLQARNIVEALQEARRSGWLAG